jgi:hypothetical protein
MNIWNFVDLKWIFAIDFHIRIDLLVTLLQNYLERQKTFLDEKYPLDIETVLQRTRIM